MTLKQNVVELNVPAKFGWVFVLDSSMVECQLVRLETRVQSQVQDRIYLFQLSNESTGGLILKTKFAIFNNTFEGSRYILKQNVELNDLSKLNNK